MHLEDLNQASLSLGSLARLTETIADSPLPSEKVFQQLRFLILGEPLCALLLPAGSWAPAQEETWKILQEHLRREVRPKSLLDIEDLLWSRGHGRWVLETQLAALLDAEEESWSHPVIVLGESYSRARLGELVELLRGQLESGLDPAELGASVLRKLLKTDELELRARNRRDRMREGAEE